MPTLLQLDVHDNIGPKVRILKAVLLNSTDAAMAEFVEANPSLLGYSSVRYGRLLFEAELSNPRPTTAWFRVGPSWYREGSQNSRLYRARVERTEEQVRVQRSSRGGGLRLTRSMGARSGVTRVRCRIDRSRARRSVMGGRSGDASVDEWLQRCHRSDSQYRRWLLARLALIDEPGDSSKGLVKRRRKVSTTSHSSTGLVKRRRKISTTRSMVDSDEQVHLEKLEKQHGTKLSRIELAQKGRLVRGLVQRPSGQLPCS